jgi:hypothetical protein
MLTQRTEGSELDAKSALKGSVLRANSHQSRLQVEDGRHENGTSLTLPFNLSGAFKGLAKDRGGSEDGGYHWS